MEMMISGLELNKQFYLEVVRPILLEEFPGLMHSAARLGQGSEVLGYDDLTSTDHDWGLRFQLFLTEMDHRRYGQQLAEQLRWKLPTSFRGYPTHFGAPDEEGTRLMEAREKGPVDHRIEVLTVEQFLDSYLGHDLTYDLTPLDWLTIPQQLLLGVTKGQVYGDDLGTLTRVRRHLAYYPQDVWYYLLSAQWVRIAQEEPFMGRAGDAGDELGSRLIAARLVHDLMQLCFLMERQYAPYPKWFGTAFSRLKCASQMGPLFERVLSAETWQAREEALSSAYERVVVMHNQLGITDPIPAEVSSFHGRPYQVIHGDRFSRAIKKLIKDDIVRGIRTNIGSIDQFSHSTDLRSYPELHKRLQGLYR